MISLEITPSWWLDRDMVGGLFPEPDTDKSRVQLWWYMVIKLHLMMNNKSTISKTFSFLIIWIKTKLRKQSTTYQPTRQNNWSSNEMTPPSASHPPSTHTHLMDSVVAPSKEDWGMGNYISLGNIQTWSFLLDDM